MDWEDTGSCQVCRLKGKLRAPSSQVWDITMSVRRGTGMDVTMQTTLPRDAAPTLVSEKSSGWSFIGITPENLSFRADDLLVRKVKIGSPSPSVHLVVGMRPVVLGERGAGMPESIQLELLNCVTYPFKADLSILSVEFRDEHPTGLDEWKALIEAHAPCVQTGTLEILPGTSQLQPFPQQDIDSLLDLLSLGLGTSVSYRTVRTRYTNGHVYDEWVGRKVNPPVVGKEIIRTHQLGAFLESCFTGFQGLGNGVRRVLSLAWEYHLAAKRSSEVELRLLNEAVAWEILVRSQIEGQPIPPDLGHLRERLKEVYDDWLRQTGYVDHDARLKSRISECVRWVPLRDGIDALCRKTNVRADGFADAIPVFVDARNSITHSGCLPSGLLSDSGIDYTATTRILDHMFFLFDLVSLQMLGYKGGVRCEKNGWVQVKPIAGFLETDA